MSSFKKLFLKTNDEINYLSCTIQSENMYLLGTAFRENIVSEIRKAHLLVIIMAITPNPSKKDQRDECKNIKIC